MRRQYRGWITVAGRALLAALLPVIASCDRTPTERTLYGGPLVPGPLAGRYAVTGAFQYMDTLTLSTTVIVTQWVGIDSVSATVGDVVVRGPHGVVATYSPVPQVGPAWWDGMALDQIRVTQRVKGDSPLTHFVALDGRVTGGLWSGYFTLGIANGPDGAGGSFSARR